MKNMKKQHLQNREDFTHIMTWLLCSFIKGLMTDKWNSLRQPVRQNQNQNQNQTQNQNLNLPQFTVSRGSACGSRKRCSPSGFREASLQETGTHKLVREPPDLYVSS